MELCKIENCGKQKKANGFCVMHNARFKKYGDPTIVKGRWDNHTKIQKPCLNEKCETLVWKGKYCAKCRARKNRTGDINGFIGNRKLKYNENILKENSSESNYFLGWIATDGYIDEKNNRVRIELCDIEPLEIIKRIIGYSGDIKLSTMRKTSKKQPYRLSISNKELVKDFVNLGIKQKKSRTIELPKIDDQNFYHFLRGVIEGDGSVVFNKYLDKRRNKITNKLFVFLNSGSLKFLEQIKERVNLGNNKILTLTYKTAHEPIYRLVWSGKYAEQLCSLLYKDSENLRLERKYQKYLDYKSIKE